MSNIQVCPQNKLKCACNKRLVGRFVSIGKCNTCLISEGSELSSLSYKRRTKMISDKIAEGHARYVDYKNPTEYYTDLNREYVFRKKLNNLREELKKTGDDTCLVGDIVIKFADREFPVTL